MSPMEDLRKLAGWLSAEWEAFSSAPFLFVAAVLTLVFVGWCLGWWVIRWYYRKQLADTKANNDLKDSVIKLVEERLRDREGKITALLALNRKLSGRGAE